MTYSRIAALLLSFTMLLVACKNKSDGGSPSESSAVEVDVETDSDGRITAVISVDSVGDQIIKSTGSSSLENAELKIPSGALSVATTITMEKGADVATSASTTELGLDVGEALLTATTPMLISSSEKVDPSEALVGRLAISSRALLLVESYLTVVYKVVKYSEGGKFYLGAIPTGELTIGAGYVEFPIKYFGSYQGLYVAKKVDTIAEQKSTTPIISSVDSAPSSFSISDTYDYANFSGELKSMASDGTNTLVIMEDGYHLTAQLYGPTGSVIGDPYAAPFESGGATAFYDGTNYQFCWRDQYDYNGRAMLCQTLAVATGASVGDPVVIYDNQTLYGIYPLDVIRSNEQIAISFLGIVGSAADPSQQINHDYYVQLLGTDMVKKKDAILVAEETGDRAIVAIDGGYFLLWSEAKTAGAIKGRILKTDGSFDGEAFVIKECATLCNYHIQAAWDGYNVGVALSDKISDEKHDLSYALVDIEGQKISSFYPFAEEQTSTIYSAIYKVENNFLLFWLGMEDNKDEMWGQYVSAEGVLLGESFKVWDLGVRAAGSTDPNYARLVLFADKFVFIGTTATSVKGAVYRF